MSRVRVPSLTPIGQGASPLPDLLRWFAMRAKMTAIAAAALALAGCGGSDHAATTVTSTPAAETKTVTVIVTPPPPPGPKTAIETNGTFVVNTDIVPGTYRTDGKDACYWARLR